jgi:hypothetical protein
MPDTTDPTIPLESTELWAEDAALAAELWLEGWRPQPILTLQAGQLVLHVMTMFGVPFGDRCAARLMEDPEERGNGTVWVPTTVGVIEADDGAEVWAQD